MVKYQKIIEIPNDYWDGNLEYLMNLKLRKKLLDFCVLWNLTHSNYFHRTISTLNSATESQKFYSFSDSLNTAPLLCVLSESSLQLHNFPSSFTLPPPCMATSNTNPFSLTFIVHWWPCLLFWEIQAIRERSGPHSNIHFMDQVCTISLFILTSYSKWPLYDFLQSQYPYLNTRFHSVFLFVCFFPSPSAPLQISFCWIFLISL